MILFVDVQLRKLLLSNHSDEKVNFCGKTPARHRKKEEVQLFIFTFISDRKIYGDGGTRHEQYIFLSWKLPIVLLSGLNLSSSMICQISSFFLSACAKLHFNKFFSSRNVIFFVPMGVTRVNMSLSGILRNKKKF